MRLGDLDVLRRKLQTKYDFKNGEEDFDKGYNLGIATAIELLDNAPTVEVDEKATFSSGYQLGKLVEERPQGEWVVTAKDNYGVHRICCPFCHFETGSNNDAPIVVTYEKLPYFCENCGADMRSGDKK